jgi:hypothetical protein
MKCVGFLRTGDSRMCSGTPTEHSSICTLPPSFNDTKSITSYIKDFPQLAVQIHCSRHKLLWIYISVRSNVRASRIFIQPAKNFKRKYTISITFVHIFTNDMVILIPATSSATSYSPSQMCHYSRGWLNLCL